MIGPAAMLGSSRLIVIVKENRASMLAFVKEDPRAAAILWGQLMEVEKLQEPYVTPKQALIQSNPFENDLQLNQAQELTKQVQAQELTKQVLAQEESKRSCHSQSEETARIAKDKEEESKRHLQSEQTARFAKEREEESKRHLQSEQTARLIKEKEENETTKRMIEEEKTRQIAEQTKQKAKYQTEMTKRKQLELDILQAKGAKAVATPAAATTNGRKRKVPVVTAPKVVARPRSRVTATKPKK